MGSASPPKPGAVRSAGDNCAGAPELCRAGCRVAVRQAREVTQARANIGPAPSAPMNRHSKKWRVAIINLSIRFMVECSPEVRGHAQSGHLSSESWHASGEVTCILWLRRAQVICTLACMHTPCHRVSHVTNRLTYRASWHAGKRLQTHKPTRGSTVGGSRMYTVDQ